MQPHRFHTRAVTRKNVRPDPNLRDLRRVLSNLGLNRRRSTNHNRHLKLQDTFKRENMKTHRGRKAICYLSPDR